MRTIELYLIKLFNQFYSAFANLVYNLFKRTLIIIQQIFGYPFIPGLSTDYKKPFFGQILLFDFTKLFDHLEYPQWFSGGDQAVVMRAADESILEPVPENLLEVLLGEFPKTVPHTHVHFIDSQTGFYNFYLHAYRDIIFLPNFISQFLQLNFNLGVDYNGAVLVRESLFCFIYIYREAMFLNLTFGMLLALNPYRFPLRFLRPLVDWWEYFINRIFKPGAGGGMIDIGNPLLIFLTGMIADFLNNLTFTFPYLPGEVNRMLLAQSIEPPPGAVGPSEIVITPIYLFSGLPFLWAEYGVPNEIRKYWYEIHPEITRYMHDAYSYIDLNVLPDGIYELPTLIQEKVNGPFHIFARLFGLGISNSVDFYQVFNNEFMRNSDNFFSYFNHFSL